MKITLLFALSIFTISCGHHRDVRPSANGLHLVSFPTEDKSSGYQNGIAQARHYCKEADGNKNAFVDKENYKYVGNMKEDDYKKMKTASKVAQGVGGAVWSFGGERESNAGGILGLGGAVADGVAGQGYVYRMTFRCK